MSNCKHCKSDCAHRGEEREHVCMGYIAMTNADRIRAMTDEELVNVVPCPSIFSMFGCKKEMKCGDCKRDWLQQPCGGADHA